VTTSLVLALTMSYCSASLPLQKAIVGMNGSATVQAFGRGSRANQWRLGTKIVGVRPNNPTIKILGKIRLDLLIRASIAFG